MSESTPETSSTGSVKKSVVATAIVASTLGGVAAGAAFFTPAIAGAQDDTSEESPALSRLEEILQPLVDDGTIDEAQRDAVVETLDAARGERHDRHGVRGAVRAGFGTVAEALGLEPAEVRDALQDGDTIADLAEQQGVDLDTIVDALVAQAEERLDSAVESGRIDETQAAELLERAEENAEDIVNGEFEFGRRGHGRFGPGANGDAADDDASNEGEADDTDTSA